VDGRQQTTIPGVFAAGDICAKQVRQVATAVSDGAVAAINAAAFVAR
jgi:thioredoxin reductase (NADPH)